MSRDILSVYFARQQWLDCDNRVYTVPAHGHHRPLQIMIDQSLYITSSFDSGSIIWKYITIRIRLLPYMYTTYYAIHNRLTW